MARLISIGAELNSVTNGVEFTSSGGTSTISTSVTRSGTYSLKPTISSGSATYESYQFAAAAGNGPYYVRAYVHIATKPSANETRILLLNDAAGSIATPTVY